MQLWVSPLITWKEYNKEGQQGAISYTLPSVNLLISHLPTPQLNVQRTIWKDQVTCKNEINKKTRRGVLSFTLSFLPIANTDEHGMGDAPPLSHILPEVK